ncbi:hypothetical protein P4132_12095 [Pseudomonas aeruginosa]|nr:hypothetical protein [Pseudomonas aeruginosa]
MEDLAWPPLSASRIGRDLELALQATWKGELDEPVQEQSTGELPFAMATCEDAGIQVLLDRRRFRLV